MLNKPRKSFMQPMTVCLPQLNSYRCHTQLHARLWKYLGSYRRLVNLCVLILFIWYQKVKFSHLMVFRDKGPFGCTTEMLNRESRTHPLTCEVMWIYPSRQSFLWDYVTEHIYIWPFGVLLMERHNEIKHVLRSALFWDCMHHRVVIVFWCFGISNGSHL